MLHNQLTSPENNIDQINSNKHLKIIKEYLHKKLFKDAYVSLNNLLITTERLNTNLSFYKIIVEINAQNIKIETHLNSILNIKKEIANNFIISSDLISTSQNKSHCVILIFNISKTDFEYSNIYKSTLVLNKYDL